jgi:predicted membrane channel-forming protein YqfA (hemolysin III family)
MPQRYLLKEITIIMISTSITLFCLMKMLDKHIICIIVLVQLFVASVAYLQCGKPFFSNTRQNEIELAMFDE